MKKAASSKDPLLSPASHNSHQSNFKPAAISVFIYAFLMKAIEEFNA